MPLAVSAQVFECRPAFRHLQQSDIRSAAASWLHVTAKPTATEGGFQQQGRTVCRGSMC